MFIASEVFPMLGRAATTIISPRMHAAGHLVQVGETRRHAGEHPLPLVEFLDRADRLLDQLLHRTALSWTRDSLIRSTSFSTSSSSASTSPS